MANRDSRMAIGANSLQKDLEFTLGKLDYSLNFRQKKARKTLDELRANSHMLRGRNIGQGTCLHARGGHALTKIVRLGHNANISKKYVRRPAHCRKSVRV